MMLASEARRYGSMYGSRRVSDPNPRERHVVRVGADETEALDAEWAASHPTMADGKLVLYAGLALAVGLALMGGGFRQNPRRLGTEVEERRRRRGLPKNLLPRRKSAIPWPKPAPPDYYADQTVPSDW